MSYVAMRDEVRALLARLHATLDGGGDVAAMARAHEPLLRQARALAGRLATDEREELAALVAGVARLRAIAENSALAIVASRRPPTILHARP